jgi:hypothetical protein
MPERDRFLDQLPPDLLERASLPLPYQTVSQVRTSEGKVPQRVAESSYDRATVYTCVPFFKPISRCVGGRP